MVGTAVCPARLQAKCNDVEVLSPGDHMYSLEFDGITRMFIVHVPPGYDGKKPVPVVLDLHGFSSNGSQQLGLSGFSEVADESGFIVVAPTGYMNSFNGDIEFGSAKSQMLDDVGFMKALVKYVGELANIDRARVYSTGLSNGAAMTNTLGCQATDTFAGVAPVADPLDIGRATCMPQPIAVLGFHGYDDEYVPYEGGPGGGPPLPEPFPSIPDTLAAWGKLMGCTGEPELVAFEGRNKCEIFRTCGRAVQVGYCSLEGGHVLYQQNGLDIADYAWKFLSQFSLPLPDADADGINDEDDNCPNTANPDQADANGNCVGDACECSTPADCDDGMFCNGSELCTSGVCGPGSAPCQAPVMCDEAAKQCADASAMPEAGSAAAGSGAGQSAGAPAGASAASGAGASGAGAAGRGSTSSPVGTAGANSAGGGAGVSSGAGGAGMVPPAAPAARSDDGCSASGSARGSSAGVLVLLAFLLLSSRRRIRTA